MKKKQGKKGFLLIEAMLATTVLVFGIVAVIPLVSFSLREAMDSRDQVIAGMLAQEGVELVQNLRDNNWVQVPAKTAFQDNFPSSNKTDCRIDYNSSDVKTCGSSFKLYLDGSNFYAHSGATATKFQRKIELAFDTNNNTTAKQLVITSVTVWGTAGFPPDPISAANCNTTAKCVFTKTTLTTWHQ
ncbi:MAG: hypothetical protein NTY33_03115 [Candidatus Moranbacteria bacterium]|nr:hypothetical protein [Candidatus Moranbacteria bacterium]